MDDISFTIWIASMGVLFALWLVLFLRNYYRDSKSTVLSLWAMFLGNLIVYSLMFGTCFILHDDSPVWPEAAFWVLFFAYVGAELVAWVFIIVNNSSWFQALLKSFHSKVGTNPLKGWGGETFADLSNGFGILVVVGINVIFHLQTGSFWWAGQIAALLSVMGAAAWVQRFSFEVPEVYRGWQEYIPKFLEIIAVMLTALVMVIPNAGSGDAETRIKWLWLIVFAMWGLMASFAWFLSFDPSGRTLPWWPKFRDANLSNRGQISRFLLGIWLSAFLVTVGILFGIFGIIPSDWEDVLGYITAGIFMLSQSIGLVLALPHLNLLADIQLEKAFKLLKSIGFVLIGLFLIIVQAMGEQWLTNEVFKMLYIVILGVFVTLAFIGVLADACRMAQKWEAEQQRLAIQPQPPVSARPVPQGKYSYSDPYSPGDWD